MMYMGKMRYKPLERDFKRNTDEENLREDWRKVGENMREVMGITQECKKGSKK